MRHAPTPTPATGLYRPNREPGQLRLWLSGSGARLSLLACLLLFVALLLSRSRILYEISNVYLLTPKLT